MCCCALLEFVGFGFVAACVCLLLMAVTGFASGGVGVSSARVFFNNGSEAGLWVRVARSCGFIARLEFWGFSGQMLGMSRLPCKTRESVSAMQNRRVAAVAASFMTLCWARMGELILRARIRVSSLWNNSIFCYKRGLWNSRLGCAESISPRIFKVIIMLCVAECRCRTRFLGSTAVRRVSAQRGQGSHSIETLLPAFEIEFASIGIEKHE